LVATLAGPPEAGLALCPPLEHPTNADAQPRVPIATAITRFTGLPSVMRRPDGVVMAEVQIAACATDPNK